MMPISRTSCKMATPPSHNLHTAQPASIRDHSVGIQTEKKNNYNLIANAVATTTTTTRRRRGRWRKITTAKDNTTLQPSAAIPPSIRPLRQNFQKEIHSKNMKTKHKKKNNPFFIHFFFSTLKFKVFFFLSAKNMRECNNDLFECSSHFSRPSAHFPHVSCIIM